MFDESPCNLDYIRCACFDLGVSSFAVEKDIGQCMRVDCASMQQYCEESHKAGKTGTNCAVAGKACLQSNGPRWHGVTADGKKWTCKF
jgi:hypothetical protein